MMQFVLIGVGAGTAAALLFASVTSGVGFILFYLAPLPILIAALGWSHWAGLAAAVAAAAMLGGVFGIFFFVTFLTSVGAPAWWLGYLALLSRPVANGGVMHTEWYPPGRLVLWAAALGAGIIAGALAMFGADESTIRSGIRGALEQVLRLQTGIPADTPLQFPGVGDADRLIDMLVVVLPPAAAVIATTTLIGNLWLSGQVVKLSSRLRRPWPNLTALAFPPRAPAFFAGAVAGAFVPNVLGLVASLFAATFAIAFAILGFSVVHTMTRNIDVRRVTTGAVFRPRMIILTVIYVIVVVQGWPILIMMLIGLAETLFGLRARQTAQRPPAAPRT